MPLEVHLFEHLHEARKHTSSVRLKSFPLPFHCISVLHLQIVACVCLFSLVFLYFLYS